MTTRTGRVRAFWLGAVVPVLICASGCSGSEGAEPSGPALPYASEIVRFTKGDGAGFGENDLPDVVLGPPSGKGSSAGSLDVLSLGVGGEIVLAFGDASIEDGEGPDFVVFENAFYAGGDPTQVFAEPGEVAVSEDGSVFVTFPCDAEAKDVAHSGCAGVTPTAQYDANENLPLDPEISGGDAFDLARVGLAGARYVRIRDRSAEGAAPSAGFDLDAVGFVSRE